ncbi:nucleotidyl transferase AbiEii/AbiGii toxin family protein [Luedemannella flava]
MVDVSGDFEIHITAPSHEAEKLAEFADRHGVTFVHILLDRGAQVSQPMLSLTGSGTLDEQRILARSWYDRLRQAGMHPCRIKVEAAPWCAGVPRSDDDAAAEPTGRYFEHHVKVLLPELSVEDLTAITDLVAPHGARLSRNARRQRPDGRHERFVNQRCLGVGLATARRRLDDLVTTLRAAGHEILQAEQEYVVSDDHLSLDNGWLDAPASRSYVVEREQRMRAAPAGTEGYPATYRPLPEGAMVRQSAAFDPALKNHANAYRAGEPVFLDAAAGQRWRQARRAAMDHLLAVIARSELADNLVLRGSVTLAAWVGAAAREPGDLDFVVIPHTMTSDSVEARRLLDGLRAAVAAAPGAGLRAWETAESAIWTYERADGRRLVIPFGAPGVPDGTVQVDLVFGERLPLTLEALAAERLTGVSLAIEKLTLPGVDVPVLAAPAPLALAWKLLWLATDIYPQGKDLYDAVLLAEHTRVGLPLVRNLMRAELGNEANDFTAETVLSWDIDWTNFTDEYPGIDGDAESWRRRLARALERAWS